MRKLVWFTLGFGMASGLCVWLLPNPGEISLSVLCPILTVLFAVLSRKWKYLRIATLLSLGLWTGLSWFSAYEHLFLRTPKGLDGAECSLTVVCSDYSYETAYGCAVDGMTLLEGKRYQIRIYLDEDKALIPGDTVIGSFRLRFTAPDGAEEATYHAGKGIFLLGYQEDEAVYREAVSPPLWCYPALWRQQIRKILCRAFPEDVYPFTKALLLGDGNDLDYETDTALKLSGIRHIIAVSGLHISILYSLISFFTAKRRSLTALVGIPVLFLFAAVAGFSPSVVRACIMVGLMMGAMLFQREFDAPTALAFACLVMLTMNPLVITSVSFQLSVGCVAGILLFNVSINEWLKARIPGAGRLKAWLCSGISVTLSAMSLTTPLAAYYFGTVSLVGVVTNLLTLWVVNLVFNGLVITCLVSLLSSGAGALLGSLLAWPVRYVLVTAKFLGGLPLAAVYTCSPYVTAWLVFCYVLLGVFLLSKNRRPGHLICCALLSLCVALLASWTEPLTDGSRMTVLDVGQGQSILLQSGPHTFLVDCGGESDTETADAVAETLLSQGISRLDGIILTHYDRDHMGALENLLTRIEADRLLAPRTTESIAFHTGIQYVSEDLLLSFGDASLTVFGPILPGSDNENSLCVLFESENCAILITGDRSGFGERMLLRHTVLPDIDVLVAGHHGSQNATCEELLQAVKPEIVIISVGEGNPYGHPAPALLRRLKEFGCNVYRTDQCGTIIFRR